jgi:hypothetical protein
VLIIRMRTSICGKLGHPNNFSRELIGTLGHVEVKMDTAHGAF